MNMKTFDISVLGASHIKKGTVCQDYSISNSNNKWSYAVVCDGHGGGDYVRSNKGSEFGCKSAEFMINSMMSQISSEKFFSESESLLCTLEKRIIKKWRETVEAHYRNNPFTDSELSRVSAKAYDKYKNGNIYSAYGTTLVAVVMTHDYWFGIQIGDGKLITVDLNGNFSQPVPENPACFANATTSMCDDDAFENFRGCFSCDNPEYYNAKINNIPDIEKKNHFVAYGRELPSAVIVSSDGVDNCFKEDEQMYNFYKTVLYSFGTSDFYEAENSLKGYLPKLSEKGSGDDISVSAILDMDIVPELPIVKEYDMNEQRQKVVDAKRREQEANEAEKRIVAERVARLDREKLAEMQGKIDLLEKSRKQIEKLFKKSEEENRELSKSLRKTNMELQRLDREYNALENDYNSLRRDLRRASDSVKICHNCGIISLGRSRYCNRCEEIVTEYRKYTEKKDKSRNRRMFDNTSDPYFVNPYPDKFDIPDGNTVRKNTDIDVPIAEEDKQRQEKIQKIKENSDENRKETNKISLDKDYNIPSEFEPYDFTSEKTNTDTENINTSENNDVYEDSVKSEPEETIFADRETNTDTDDFNVPENNDVYEDSEKSEPEETIFVDRGTNTDTDGFNIPENTDIHEDSEENKSDKNDNDDDDDFVPKIIENGILDD